MSSLRVGFVVHVMQVAGAEMLVAELARGLRDRIDPVVLCLDDVGELGEKLRLGGVDVVGLSRRPGLDAGLVWRLAREIGRRRLEIVHAHQYTPFFYSALAKLVRFGGFRLILTEHGRHWPDEVSARRRWGNRLLLARLADRINACSEFSRRALAEVDGFARDRIEVIVNGVAVGEYGPASVREEARRRLGLDPDKRYVTMIGRFHPVKDHATMIRAFALVAASRPDAELLLIGDGPLRPEIEAQVRDTDLASRVRFLGIRHDVPEILGVVDLFVLTSVSEAASLTLLEAMASELPVVVTAVGGNPEIVRDGVEGILVPRGDHRAVAEAVSRLLETPAEAAKMGRAGRRRVESNYRLEQTIEAYGRLYASLTGAAGGEEAGATRT